MRAPHETAVKTALRMAERDFETDPRNLRVTEIARVKRPSDVPMLHTAFTSSGPERAGWPAPWARQRHVGPESWYEPGWIRAVERRSAAAFTGGGASP